MKPQLLLHICCAPDEAWVVHSLKDQYTLHCYFCNPNIAPQEEYTLRLTEAALVAKRYNIPFSADNYNPNSWEAAIAPYCTTVEGGMRCLSCFSLRLERTAQYCKTIGFPAFTTVMSISPHKRITMLDTAGIEAAEKQQVVFQSFNFKKNDGFKNSIALSHELGLYRQDYCGCRLSRAERDRRNTAKELLNKVNTDSI